MPAGGREQAVGGGQHEGGHAAVPPEERGQERLLLQRRVPKGERGPEGGEIEMEGSREQESRGGEAGAGGQERGLEVT